ncbi:hypothetical protein LWI29_000215 [Acer saccharum]|uniref:ABC transporter domain-containing protein n=1 Tax=Acer saccharum TaxID=4024 RepID=A0AA39VM80_ACESA|nr:hypothetical protein LWI29_000215 [Acer saccharum]
MVSTDEIESLRIELAEIGSSFRSSFRRHSFSFGNSSMKDDIDVEHALQWAAIERLPAFERLKSSLFDKEDEGNLVDGKGKRVIDVTKLGALEQHLFMEKLIKHVEHDNLQLLQKIRKRIDKMTLLLGPPGCGKTTLLKSLSGNQDQSLKVTGEVSYNGYRLEEFVPQKTSAYISQNDQHIAEMTVRETLDFSACCLGVGSRAEIMMEVSKREKEAGIFPDPDIDTYMKILGLEICADTLVGDVMRRGISGGQKKRLTTGEMIIGPTKALFMDEITNGLDSSTAYQIVACLQQVVHITDSIALVSLLQPAPETFDLFDDIILMAEGKIVYHGPRDNVLDFFEDCGFRCPQRKGVADFLQEVISRKDQEQYWFHTEIPYNFVSADMFSRKFKESRLGKKLDEDLSEPYDKSKNHKNALSSSVYSISRWNLFKACMSRELLLMKRNSFVYVFKTTQLIIVAIITMTVFLRAELDVDVIDANYYMGALFFALIILLVDGIPELSMTIARLEVFYKQKKLCFYPAWAYAIPATILKVPLSIIESLAWTSLTYYVIGYSPEVWRFFCQFILLFAVHFTSVSMFRFLASVFQTMVMSMAAGSFSILFVLLFGGFVITKPSMPVWLKWGFWVSPITYGEIGLSVNEFLAPRWQKTLSTNTTIGRATLESRGLNFDGYFFWISLGALFGFALAFNIGFTLALSFLKSPGSTRAMISHEIFSKIQGSEDSCDGKHAEKKSSKSPDINKESSKGRMVLPFKPLTIAFQDVQYHYDTPLEFVNEVLETIELDGIKDALVGIPGVSGLSTEQRKRLTIAVELVANPSIIFMDEPTTGLDARAAAIVMRAVKNVADTGRTIVCTIHQPSIDIFESFDELILLKSGGCMIYSGPLGKHSSSVIEYFEGISGVQKIKDNYNPATWMLDVTSTSAEAELGVDFAQIYRDSVLFENNKELVKQLSTPPPGSRDLHFPTRFSQSGCGQFKSCLWKQNLSYWRSPSYNLMRILHTLASSLFFGILFWKQGKKLDNQQNLFNILGSIYASVIFLGINNCSSVLPYVAMERTVMYREKFAGMYSPRAYALAQKIPKWWIWLYYLTPSSWALNGMLTSQYGDVDKDITVFGEMKQLGSFLEDYFGYYHDRLAITAVVLIAFPVVLASLFAYFIGRLNFQRR